jgi:hypothetical protein
MLRLRAITPSDATKTAAEWPIPHQAPTRHELQNERPRPTIAETATRWSASRACLRPRRNPRPSVARSVAGG